MPKTTERERPAGRASARGFADGGPAPGRRRWTNLRPLVLVLTLAVLGGAAWWTVTRSSLLDARTVAVDGPRALTAEQVTQVAAVPLGTPLARVDLGAIRARVAAIPRVASADVSRDWPHTVRIDIRERVTALVIPDGDRFAEIDADGVRFGAVDQAPQGVPVVRADPNTVTAATLGEVAKVVKALPESIGGRVREITARTRDDIVLGLDGGQSVLWGGAEDSARKAAVLNALLPGGARFYDVSAPDTPVTRTDPPPDPKTPPPPAARGARAPSADPAGGVSTTSAA